MHVLAAEQLIFCGAFVIIFCAFYSESPAWPAFLIALGIWSHNACLDSCILVKLLKMNNQIGTMGKGAEEADI